MPKRVPFPGTNIPPEDILPVETSQDDSNELSLRAFFYDYCVASTNPNLSRSYIPGLEMMTYQQGPTSSLVRACQAVSFATHGKPLNRTKLVEKAGLFYQDLLGSLARAFESPNCVNAMETRYIVMLLGVYQMATDMETDYGSHDIHAKGLAALLHADAPPLNFLRICLSNFRLGETTNLHLSRPSGVFSVVALGHPGENLGDLLLSLHSLWIDSEERHSPRDFLQLKRVSVALNQQFAQWQGSRVTEFIPTTIGNIDQNNPDLPPGAGYWPGKVDTYFDLYVSGVWNVYRIARLLLIALIIKLSNASGENDACVEYIHTANCIVEDVVASIPYHLADNLQVFLSSIPPNNGFMDPGKFLGGLLLIHPLYIASELPFISEQIRSYMRTCLAWIGSDMGFGQATLLSKTPNVDRNFLASGWMIIWSGFLG
ncbi:hypothetical protein N431DRAFT_323148 [Stipitochalara longipes BDJ]|nr:hypothetical protein N431DRAFT_323148 [Stipitochalara longipes BDJ]